MGWDFAEETVRILNEGLPDPPPAPEPGVTFAAALHRGDRVGAVLFLRLWRNGQWDSDAAITKRTDDGGWEWPSSCGGGGWANPYERPPDGWNGEPLLVVGQIRTSIDHEDGSSTWATAIEGMAARAVTRIICTTETVRFAHDINSPLGAFVIVVEGELPPSLTALGAYGQRL